MNSAESCSLILTNNLRTVCDIFYTHASKSLISFPTPIVTEKRTRMFLREAGGDKWQWCHGHKNYHDEPWLLNKTQELPAHSDGSVNRFFSSKKGLDLIRMSQNERYEKDFGVFGKSDYLNCQDCQLRNTWGWHLCLGKTEASDDRSLPVLLCPTMPAPPVDQKNWTKWVKAHAGLHTMTNLQSNKWHKRRNALIIHFKTLSQ